LFLLGARNDSSSRNTVPNNNCIRIVDSSDERWFDGWTNCRNCDWNLSWSCFDYLCAGGDCKEKKKKSIRQIVTMKKNDWLINLQYVVGQILPVLFFYSAKKHLINCQSAAMQRNGFSLMTSSTSFQNKIKTRKSKTRLFRGVPHAGDNLFQVPFLRARRTFGQTRPNKLAVNRDLKKTSEQKKKKVLSPCLTSNEFFAPFEEETVPNFSRAAETFLQLLLYVDQEAA
jgi:hypothetical protein